MGHAIRGGSDRGRGDDPARLLALLSSLRDIVLVRDADGILTYCSPSVSNALGYQPDELEGTPERDLIHASDVTPATTLVSALAPGRPAAAPDRRPAARPRRRVALVRVDRDQSPRRSRGQGHRHQRARRRSPQSRERRSCSNAASATR